MNLALKSVVILFSHGSLRLKSKSIGESTDKHVNIAGLRNGEVSSVFECTSTAVADLPLYVQILFKGAFHIFY